MQGAEIRKFISDQIKDYIKVQNLDPVQLSKTIDQIKVLVDENIGSVKSIVDLVNGNKNAIDRASQELKDLIMKSNAEGVATLRAEWTKALGDQNKEMSDQITALKQECSFRQALDVPALFNAFTKSLWNYGDYICTKTVTVGSGSVPLRFKLSGDHYNPNAVSGDIGIGSPEVKIEINGSVVYQDKVLAVKYLNQYEYITIMVAPGTTQADVTFTVDAWEGGSDRNEDGVSEDRNLYVFEIVHNGVVIDSTKLKSGAVPNIMYGSGKVSYKW